MSPRSSGDGDPLLRFFANAGREASQLTARNCPVLTVISAPSWKHWGGVSLALAAGLGLLFAGYAAPHWPGDYGPGARRLFHDMAAPIVSWGNTLVLFMSAQAACIVLWARSHSLRDFGGSYRIWAWAGATYLLFSFATATHAHLALSETVLYHIRWRTPGAALWCWLLPASAWGWGLALRLEQDMREDRWGHWLFLTAGAWYMGVVGMLCQRQFAPEYCPAELSAFLVATLQLLGHACLFLSTVLHARFVLCCTAEPPLPRRRTAAKTTEAARAKSSWLSWLWPTWLLRSTAAEEEAEETPKKGRKKAAPKKRAPARKSTRAAKVEAEADEEEWEDTDGEEESLSEEVAAEGNNYRFDPPQDLQGDHYSESDEEDDSQSGRGLSKRERRRLQQEQREQERGNRR